jgi:hypothetical protein
MRIIGFSTGAIARGDFRSALEILRQKRVRAIELSALREVELLPLINSLESFDLRPFEYVALHAPSELANLDEASLIDRLQVVKARSIPIVVHPDIIRDISLWRELGDYLCIENMDRRKKTGRTCRELAFYLESLPEASWCFDIGHAHQVDPTMSEAVQMLRDFRLRLKHLHVSSVNSSGGHEAITYGIGLAFKRVLHLVPSDAPIILEACISFDEIEAELSRAAEIFDSPDSKVPSQVTVAATS